MCYLHSRESRREARENTERRRKETRLLVVTCFIPLKMFSVFHAGEYVGVWATSLSRRKVKILFSSHWNIPSWTKKWC